MQNAILDKASRRTVMKKKNPNIPQNTIFFLETSESALAVSDPRVHRVQVKVSELFQGNDPKP